MKEVITNKKGTAHKINKLSKFPTAGKTGTAQVHTLVNKDEYKNLPKHLKDHSWFIAFAPIKEPKIAVAVIMEHGTGSSALAASIINDYLGRKT